RPAGFGRPAAPTRTGKELQPPERAGNRGDSRPEPLGAAPDDGYRDVVFGRTTAEIPMHVAPPRVGKRLGGQADAAPDRILDPAVPELYAGRRSCLGEAVGMEQ